MSTSSWRPLVPLWLAAAFLGCGPAMPSAPTTPHAGMLLPIPEAGGSVEVVKKAVEGRAGQVQRVVYFYGPDSRPMATPPAAATFAPAARGVKPFPLKDSGGGDGSMISGPMPDAQGAAGTLRLTLEGKPVAIPINDR